MQKIKTYIISLTLFFTPLFFLPITHEFYNINKFLLLATTCVMLLSISTIQFIQTRELRWSKKSLWLLLPFVVFLASVFLSTLLGSTNKVQPLFNFTFGPSLLSVLTIFYWYISREESDYNAGHLLRFSGFCISLITLVFLLNPFDAVALPRTFQFLKNQEFSPVGAQIDLLLFLGFISIYQLSHIIKVKRLTNRIDAFASIGIAISIIALTLSFVSYVSKSASNKIPQTAPVNLSVRTASRVASAPTGLMFGVGIGNFSSALTQAKDSTYNSSHYWTRSSFDDASSAALQIFIESGMVGLLAIAGVFVFGFLFKNKKSFPLLLVYLAIAFLIVPASFMLFFLLYCSLGLSVSESTLNREKLPQISTNKLFIPAASFSAIVLIAVWYLFCFLLIPGYRAEIAMRSSIDAITKNDLKELYDQQYKAVNLSPFIERYRLNFSQTNLFVAKQMAAQQKPNQVVITKSVQRAIDEAQAAVSLNSKKASNWENLGIVYRNVLGVKGAEQWAIAAFQRAILLDPQNVSYRLELGGVYYSLKQYENAIKTFQDATLLKPDLPNSYYNLAYAYYQNKDTNNAVKVMDALLALLKKQSSANYEKVLKERKDFASGVPQKQAPSVLQ